MRQSLLFTKTRKDAPKDEIAKNAELLIRAGYIHKEMAGVYSYLPLGIRVLNNIIQIIRQEMNAIGGQEVLLTALQSKEVWQKTNRWSDTVVDNWFKTRLKNDAEVGLGFTHEEPLTNLMTEYISSYRDLPTYVYQFQTKFRNEARAKSGIMRGREFIMKDLYSFSKDQAEHEMFYEKAKQAYKKIFDRVGIGEKTYLTFASGGTFSTFSHEFQTITTSGEDSVYTTKEKINGETIAINKEIYTDDLKKELGLEKSEFQEVKAVEVGNIFSLGTKFSEAFDLTYLDEKGQKKPVFMGSYGIGPGRLMGTIVEVMADEKGIVWPKSVAPFDVHVILIPGKSETKEQAENLYSELTNKGIEVLYDDRELRAGEKFADSDLLGIPYRVIVSDKTEKNIFEVKERSSSEVTMLSVEDIMVRVKQKM
jgi:prolyl-tRNA synthetase